MQKYIFQSFGHSMLNSNLSTVISQQCVNEIVKRAEKQIMIKEKRKNDQMKNPIKPTETPPILDPINEKESSSVVSEDEKSPSVGTKIIAKNESLERSKPYVINDGNKQTPQRTYRNTLKMLGEIKNGLKQLENKKEDLNGLSLEEQKINKEIQMLRQRKLSLQKSRKSYNQRMSLSNGKKAVKLQKLCQYLSPCQIIAEVRNQQEIVDNKGNATCQRQITHENKPKIRAKLISIPTKENEESPKNRSCFDVVNGEPRKRNIILPPLK